MIRPPYSSPSPEMPQTWTPPSYPGLRVMPALTAADQALGSALACGRSAQRPSQTDLHLTHSSFAN